MSRLACLGLSVLAGACSSGGQGIAGVSAPTTGGASIGVALPIDLAVPTTVLFVDLYDQVVPIGCASRDRGIHPGGEGCVELLGRDRGAADFFGRSRPLGEPIRATCDVTGETWPAFRVDPAEGVDGTDPLDGLVVWPFSRPPALIGWTHPTLPPDDPAHDLDPDLRGLLIADLDGDGILDRLFSVGPGDDPEAPHQILGELSSRPDQRVVLWESDHEELAAFAAIDLDVDGRAEVLIGAPSPEGDSVTLTRYHDGALVAVSGWRCGL